MESDAQFILALVNASFLQSNNPDDFFYLLSVRIGEAKIPESWKKVLLTPKVLGLMWKHGTIHGVAMPSQALRHFLKLR
jgi:hypothetical protein